MRSAALGLVLSFNPHRRSHTARWNREHRSKPRRSPRQGQRPPRSSKEIRPSSDWRLSFPQQGRTDRPMAAADKMWVVLKIYAADGENGPHPHPNEDHTFVVLQGEAKFYGPNHETLRSARTKAYCLPHGTFYWFKSDER